MLEKMKPCVFFKEIRQQNGRWKCKCKFDGSLHNHCYARCPHFRPTIWYKLWRKKIIRKGRIKA